MPVVVLVAICFVTTLLLALTNSVSEPIIIRNAAITATENRKELLPDADDFTQLELDSYASSSDNKASVTEVYKANNDTGYVMTCMTKSFGGDLTMMVGLDAAGAVTGITLIRPVSAPRIRIPNTSHSTSPRPLWAEKMSKKSRASTSLPAHLFPVPRSTKASMPRLRSMLR